MTGGRTAAQKHIPVRRERLEARVSADQKELFQRAAEIQGRTLTDFVIASVHEAAVRALEGMQAVRLTASESRAFAEAVINPREPGRRLKAAAQRYITADAVFVPPNPDP